MHLVTLLFGTGWLEVGQPQTCETQFVIGVCRDANGTLVSGGRIAGDGGAIGRAGMAPGSVPLLLPDGRSVDVTISQHGVGKDRADIHVQQPDALVTPDTPTLVAQLTAGRKTGQRPRSISPTHRRSSRRGTFGRGQRCGR